MTAHPLSRYQKIIVVAVASCMSLACFSTEARASAQSSQQVGFPEIHIVRSDGIGEINLRYAPDTSSEVVGKISQGATVQPLCYTDGERIGGLHLWLKVSHEGAPAYYFSRYDDADYQPESSITQRYGIEPCGSGANVDGEGATSRGQVFARELERMTNCVLNLGFAMSVVSDLIKAVKASGSFMEFLRRVTRGDGSLKTLMSFLGGLLGLQNISDNCAPPSPPTNQDVIPAV